MLDALKEVQLSHLVENLAEGLDTEIGEKGTCLSGGEKQRTAICRALIYNPDLILADEPTGNLDSVTSMEVISLLKTCAARFHQTVIVVTHQEAIAQMADRILRVEDGKLYNAEV